MNHFRLLDYDIYSKRIGFYFYNREKIGSYFGLFLTTIYILSLFILFIVLLIRTIQRKEIRVYDSSIYSQGMPIMEVDPKSIYFAFGLEDPMTSNRFVDETIYSAKIVFFDRSKINGNFETVDRKELDFEICKEENFGENYKHLFIKGELNNSYCLKNNYNLTLAGGYKYDRMTYFRIRIYPCKNKTENNNHCKPKEVIDNYFKGGYFSILTKDIGLNPSNFSFPVLATLQDLYTTIDKQIYRDYLLYYGITEIKTDTGLFFEDIETRRYLDFRKVVESFNFRDEEEFYGGKASCSVAFRLDDIIKVQIRTYTKIKEVLSSTGGYMQLISTIFTLMALLSNRLTPELKIMNGIFNFNLNQQKMMMKIHTIKDLNSIDFSPKNNNYIYFPSKKGISLKNQNLKNNKNNNYNSFLEIEKNNDNSSSIILKLNNNEELFSQKKEIEKGFNKTIIGNSKISVFLEHKNNHTKDIDYKNDNNNISNNPYSKKINNISLINPKNISNNSMQEFNDKINFNLFQYYCFGRTYRKRKEISLFKLGISLYKKTMDIINVFTFLLLIEKNIQFKKKSISSFFKDLE